MLNQKRRVTMHDAIEILDEIEQILEMSVTDNEQIAIIYEYLQQKRTEFQPACGECGT
jgi:hypothetical protein